MIGRLRGKLAAKQAPELLVDVNGVGYEVSAPMTTFYRLGSLGDDITLHTHLVVREDAHLLFGFATLEERTLFRELIKVNGVGPKLALGILSGIEAEAFVRCVQDGDVSTLVRIPGIGKKTAERMVVELRDRAADLIGTGVGGISALPSDPQSEATIALQQLGYKPAEATRMARDATAPGDEAATIIRKALQSALR